MAELIIKVNDEDLDHLFPGLRYFHKMHEMDGTTGCKCVDVLDRLETQVLANPNRGAIRGPEIIIQIDDRRREEVLKEFARRHGGNG